MTTSYHIDRAQRLVYSRAWGIVYVAELVAHGQTLRADPQFDPTFNQILDFSGSDRLAVSYQAMRGLAGIVPFAKSARRVAVVRSDVIYGLFRMYQLILDHSESRLMAVRTLAAAFDELDVPADTRATVIATTDRIFEGS